MRIGICDCDTNEVEYIQSLVTFLLNHEADLSIQIYGGNEIQFDLEDETLDLDILVLNVGVKNSVKIAEEVNRQLPKCQVIYLSDDIWSVLDLYDTEHCYFLLRSEIEKRMKKAVFKAYKHLEHHPSKRVIKIISNRHKFYLDERYVLFLERIGRQIHVYTFWKEYVTYQSLKQIQEQMSDDMVQCHSGYIVNMNYVTAVQGKYIDIAAKYQIPLGRTYSAGFREKHRTMQEQRGDGLLNYVINAGVNNVSHTTE